MYIDIYNTEQVSEKHVQSTLVTIYLFISLVATCYPKCKWPSKKVKIVNLRQRLKYKI